MFESPKLVVMLLYPQAQILDIAGPMEVFALANKERANPYYQIKLVAQRAGAVAMSSGIQIVADLAFADLNQKVDTLLVSGGVGVDVALCDDDLFDCLHKHQTGARRVGSICTGAFILAQAGLLNERQATTHWQSETDFKRRFPRVNLQTDSIYVKDGHIYTSAGITAGIDLAMALVEEDLGRKVAMAIARKLVLYLKRSGGQQQFSHMLRAQTVDDPALVKLVDWLANNLQLNISVEQMAQRCCMSSRHFSRRFSNALGDTPAKFLERLRIDKARLLLEENCTSFKQVAGLCGFSSVEQMRRGFQRTLQLTPQSYKEHFCA